MDVRERMAARLHSLRHAMQSKGEAGYVVEELWDGMRLHAEFHEIDKLSLQLRFFEAAVDNPPPPTSVDRERLRRQADAIKQRVSYLLEDFRVIELDEQNGLAQLRSVPPALEQRSICYYEILLRGNHSLSLCRYEASGTPSTRRVVPASVTQEAFARLCDDFVAVLSL